jgi:predicted small secreted protein
MGAFNERSPNMKRYSSIISILILACAGIILSGCETTQPGAATAPPPNSGHLLVYRVANFGADLGLVLSVDGKDVGSFTEGRNYSGYLSAGQHVLTARADPYQAGKRPGRKTITVKAGQTYSYTAAWSGGNLVLVRNR